MQSKLIRLFVTVAGLLLLATAIAKIVSSGGSSRIMQESDPLLKISFREVFRVIGLIELMIALICLLSRRVILQVALIAWLSTSFSLYHFGVYWIGYRKPCPCLGNLTDALNIPPQVADIVMKVILAYMLIGSYAALLWLWRQHKRISATAPAWWTGSDVLKLCCC